MSRILILMRHAKSSWDNPALADHARVLNGRGRVSADAMGDWLRARKYVPDEAIVSDSARTRETFARLGFRCDTVFTDKLYHASTPAMTTLLKSATGNRVLMLGHNPGMAEFAELLVREAPDHPRFFDYPTCATTLIEFDIASWEEVQTGTGEVRDFVIPREITP